jgi:exosortase/archaeosortase family protein
LSPSIKETIAVVNSPIIPWVGIIGVTFALYLDPLRIAFNDALSNTFTNYILVVPFLIVIVVYLRRRFLISSSLLDLQKEKLDLKRILFGVSLCVSALVFFQSQTGTTASLEYSLLSLPLFLAGAIIAVFGFKTLGEAKFPILATAFLVTIPDNTLNYIASALAQFTSTITYDLLRFGHMPVQLEIVSGTPVLSISGPSGNVLLGVTAECSGLYSLSAFFVFAFFVGYVSLGSLPKRVMVFSIGFPFVYGLNLLRLIITFVIAYFYGVGPSLELFHLLGGSVLIFFAAIVLLFVGGKYFKISILHFVKQKLCPTCRSLAKGTCSTCGRLVSFWNVNLPSKSFVGLMVLLILGISSVSSLNPVFVFASGPSGLNVDSLITTPQKNIPFPSIPGWNLTYLYRDAQIEQTLGIQLAAAYAYTKPVQNLNSMIYVPILLQLGTTTNAYHRWEASLIVAPNEYGEKSPTIYYDNALALSSNPSITGDLLIFQRPNFQYREAVLYWDMQVLGTSYSSGRGTEFVQISIDSPVNQLVTARMIKALNDTSGIQSFELRFANQILSYWKPLSSNLSVFDALQAVGSIPLYVVVALPVGGLLLANVQGYATSRARVQKAVSKLKGSELTLINSLKVGLTEGEILQKMKADFEREGVDLTEAKLHELLDNGQKLGLVDKAVVDRKGVPTIVWKSRTWGKKGDVIPAL